MNNDDTLIADYQRQSNETTSAELDACILELAKADVSTSSQRGRPRWYASSRMFGSVAASFVLVVTAGLLYRTQEPEVYSVMQDATQPSFESELSETELSETAPPNQSLSKSIPASAPSEAADATVTADAEPVPESAYSVRESAAEIVEHGLRLERLDDAEESLEMAESVAPAAAKAKARRAAPMSRSLLIESMRSAMTDEKPQRVKALFVQWQRHYGDEALPDDIQKYLGRLREY